MNGAPWDDPKRVWLNLYSSAIGGLSSINELPDDRAVVADAVKIADKGLAAYLKRWPKESDHDDGRTE